MNDLTDTICALATPPGRSGIAVIRVSGDQSFRIYRRIFMANMKSGEIRFRHAVLGRIRDPRSDSMIDEAIATCFASPNSFTGEDMVEFSLHGSPVLIAACLDCLHAQGARLAEPGEFSMRAFLHGKFDLTQAEAINDIINATTLYQARIAERQRSGELAQQLKPLKELLKNIVVHLESTVEFEEEELAVDSREEIIAHLVQCRHMLRDWIDSYRKGRIIRDGFSLAIVGRPNVGKSSVFNALLAQDRSIVTETPGTTRDLVSESVDFAGIPVRLLDTAGIQSSDDQVERLGINKSLQAVADADAVLFVVDGAQSPSKEDNTLRERLSGITCLIVLNKMDLGVQWSVAERLEFAGDCPYAVVSAKTGYGIDDLRTMILNEVIGEAGERQQSVCITNLRHLHRLEAAEKDLTHADSALKEGLSEEFALIDLYSGLKNLGAITGEVNTDELLGEIFSRFCVGK